ncbi:hypothetical protein PWT90_06114 [Aphanocladium album]|nr:hypothetical protein PWT90_06114 [Aphanocladium album]
MQEVRSGIELKSTSFRGASLWAQDVFAFATRHELKKRFGNVSRRAALPRQKRDGTQQPDSLSRPDTQRQRTGRNIVL